MATNKNMMSIPDAQDIVTLACFSEKAAPQLFASVTLRHLPNDKLREVFSRAKDYFDEYGKPVGSHITNEFADELNDRKQRARANGYRDLIEGLMENAEEVNAEYVLKGLRDFLWVQELRGNIPKLVENLEDNKLKETEAILNKLASTKQEEDFNYIWASDMEQVYQGIFHREVGESLEIGIKELDENNVRPTKKELLVMLAPPKRGKSWFGVQCLRAGVQNRRKKWKTLLITLEMAHVKFGERFVQNLWGRCLGEPQEVSSTVIERDEFGFISNLQNEPRYQCESILDTFADEKHAARATQEWFEKHSTERPFVMAQFPTGAFTMRKLRALVDWLDKVEGWHPDQIILDYPGIMKLDINNKRQAMNQLYQDLRGFAVTNNIAMVAFHQSNRDGAREQGIDDVIDETNAGEDFSVTQHADYLITYNQSPVERELNLARLYVPLNRNGKDKYQIVISQNYATGQFCLTSAYRGGDYTGLVVPDAEEANENPTRERAAVEPPKGFQIDEYGTWFDPETGEVWKGNNKGAGNGEGSGFLKQGA
ncbi:DNA primase/helicase [Vibrio phage vB_VpaS_MAR10]|uniref:DNA primase/helicase n=1 Tax=Vibrio phage vB_VpaS_MAR10 TaxID=1229755 RepID=K7R9F1_9CAUD|nr:DNA primase/helicase [Vibrio phage vB_VpaS_MAR10]AFV81293.1 DNA primase/helicase [Vibrio phage vB_VpaS_MAR10]